MPGLPPTLDNLNIRALSVKDIDEVLRFRASIIAGLPNPDYVFPESDEVAWAQAHLGESGNSIGLFDDDAKLVAYAALLFPSVNAPENLGVFLGMNDMERGDVAHIASCMVSPPFRGHHLQRLLIRHRVSEALEMGRGTILALSSLHNNPSRHNLMVEGFRVRWVGETAPRRFRQILQYLPDELPGDDGNRVEVEAEDLARQIALTREGFLGLSETPDRPRPRIAFYRRGAVTPK